MLVLASGSPRRQDLLRSAGISFVVQPADVDETPLADEPARDCAERLARDKALAVWRKRPDDVAQDAARMLRMLSGRVHEVITGVCVVKAGARSAQSQARELPHDPEVATASETTLVTVSLISDDEIRNYVATGEPMDKAGAYAIQGIASRWIPRIEGDYSNVVGLPVALTYRMLGEVAGGQRSAT
jgi:septum formation protein